MQMWHLPHLHHICHSFGPDLLAFAPRKFGVNPFFRQKSKRSEGREGGREGGGGGTPTKRFMGIV